MNECVCVCVRACMRVQVSRSSILSFRVYFLLGAVEFKCGCVHMPVCVCVLCLCG